MPAERTHQADGVGAGRRQVKRGHEALKLVRPWQRADDGRTQQGAARVGLGGRHRARTASAAIGAPLTHRGLAQSVTFVTGHAASGGEPDLDWAALARPNHTVAVYMGLTTAPAIAARLIAAGRARSTPVAVVENVSRENERRLVTTLGALPEAVASLSGPVILVIGETAGLAMVEEIDARIRKTGTVSREGQA